MGKTLYLRGAFGRQYVLASTMLIDWNLGKDFRSPIGYCSNRDTHEMLRMGYTEICFASCDGISLAGICIIKL